MQAPHFTRRQLRLTACVALFAWVFALVSGVANACLLQTVEPGATIFSLAAGAQTAGCHSGVAPSDHHADSGRGEPAQHGDKAVCLKFCADKFSPLAKSKSSQADLPSLVPMASAPWLPAVQVAAVSQWWPVERPASVGPPLFLRLLRLTI